MFPLVIITVGSVLKHRQEVCSQSTTVGKMIFTTVQQAEQDTGRHIIYNQWKSIVSATSIEATAAFQCWVYFMLHKDAMMFSAYIYLGYSSRSGG